MKAFKLFNQRKNGTLGPLFINRKQIIPIDKWLPAKNIPTKGFAVRPGWHTAPYKAQYLSEKDRVWMEVEIKNYYKFDRPKHQGGYWLIAKEMRVVGPA
ncbi:MAG: hypothetical protein DRO11_04915 [Methanobacteriota archaeon]|nr:MAG: hypothetical protein DRO11_04915 [Euryarchaeota archaeon]